MTKSTSLTLDHQPNIRTMKAFLAYLLFADLLIGVIFYAQIDAIDNLAAFILAFGILFLILCFLHYFLFKAIRVSYTGYSYVSFQNNAIKLIYLNIIKKTIPISEITSISLHDGYLLEYGHIKSRKRNANDSRYSGFKAFHAYVKIKLFYKSKKISTLYLTGPEYHIGYCFQIMKEIQAYISQNYSIDVKTPNFNSKLVQESDERIKKKNKAKLDRVTIYEKDDQQHLKISYGKPFSVPGIILLFLFGCLAFWILGSLLYFINQKMMEEFLVNSFTLNFLSNIIFDIVILYVLLTTAGGMLGLIDIIRNQQIVFNFSPRGIQIFDLSKQEEKAFLPRKNLALIKMSKSKHINSKSNDPYRKYESETHCNLSLRFFTNDGKKMTFRYICFFKVFEEVREMAGAIESYIRDEYKMPEVINPFY